MYEDGDNPKIQYTITQLLKHKAGFMLGTPGRKILRNEWLAFVKCDPDGVFANVGDGTAEQTPRAVTTCKGCFKQHTAIWKDGQVHVAPIVRHKLTCVKLQ